ncbi:GNAT family N-acetyltransferase [uncultured Maritalea sp.]|jgi:aminoglycoside 6'-N-acetyltransferase I|uniref:GNAT family N-acetyltransferase n=1 Tax=uncultured Maritalea sp. TaxID=757249 RepID=UPI00263A2CDA|nr:GNAT family N-acetyltransferase [uncultured Maritalea sp.]
MQFEVRKMKPEEWRDWVKMRQILFRGFTDEDAETEAKLYLSGEDPNLQIVFLAFVDGQSVGFADIARRSYADGCYDGPVAYLEGWFVQPEFRKSGIAKALIDTAADWAREQGYPHMASDSELKNVDGHKAHEACGFHEIGRVVQFRKNL